MGGRKYQGEFTVSFLSSLERPNVLMSVPLTFAGKHGSGRHSEDSKHSVLTVYVLAGVIWTHLQSLRSA